MKFLLTSDLEYLAIEDYFCKMQNKTNPFFTFQCAKRNSER